jgi:hypothetical protein
LVGPIIAALNAVKRLRDQKSSDSFNSTSACFKMHMICASLNRAVFIKNLLRYSIPDDHIDPRRSAFFMARSVLEGGRREKRDARSTAEPSDDNTED